MRAANGNDGVAKQFVPRNPFAMTTANGSVANEKQFEPPNPFAMQSANGFGAGFWYADGFATLAHAF